MPSRPKPLFVGFRCRPFREKPIPVPLCYHLMLRDLVVFHTNNIELINKICFITWFVFFAIIGVSGYVRLYSNLCSVEHFHLMTKPSTRLRSLRMQLIRCSNYCDYNCRRDVCCSCSSLKLLALSQFSYSVSTCIKKFHVFLCKCH